MFGKDPSTRAFLKSIESKIKKPKPGSLKMLKRESDEEEEDSYNGDLADEIHNKIQSNIKQVRKTNNNRVRVDLGSDEEAKHLDSDKEKDAAEDDDIDENFYTPPHSIEELPPIKDTTRVTIKHGEVDNSPVVRKRPSAKLSSSLKTSIKIASKQKEETGHVQSADEEREVTAD